MECKLHYRGLTVDFLTEYRSDSKHTEKLNTTPAYGLFLTSIVSLIKRQYNGKKYLLAQANALCFDAKTNIGFCNLNTQSFDVNERDRRLTHQPGASK